MAIKRLAGGVGSAVNRGIEGSGGRPSAAPVRRFEWIPISPLPSRKRVRVSRRGGIPIGSVLVIDGQIVGRGHNRRVQKGSAILHAEMDAIENAGRLKAADYGRATLYTTRRRATCAQAPPCSTRFRAS